MPNTATTHSLTLDATTPLLPNSSTPDCQPSPTGTEPLSNTRYFFLILRQRRIIASLLLSTILSTAYNSFNATLALHVEETFSWGPRQVGFLFLTLAGPSVLLGPPVGWLRDSIGVRAPTILGTGLATLSYILIGLPGSGIFVRMRSLDGGKGIYIGGLVMMGVAIELTAGICIIEGTRMLRFMKLCSLEESVLLLIPIGLCFSCYRRLGSTNAGHFRSERGLFPVSVIDEHVVSHRIIGGTLGVRLFDY